MVDKVYFKELELTEEQKNAIKAAYPDIDEATSLKDMMSEKLGIIAIFKKASELNDLIEWNRKTLKEIYGDEY